MEEMEMYILSFPMMRQRDSRKCSHRELAAYGGDARGVYAGEKFYLIVGNTVESYTLSGFEKIDDIVLGSIEPVAVE